MKDTTFLFARTILYSTIAILFLSIPDRLWSLDTGKGFIAFSEGIILRQMP